jgi:hypothetical protein
MACDCGWCEECDEDVFHWRQESVHGDNHLHYHRPCDAFWRWLFVGLISLGALIR